MDDLQELLIRYRAGDQEALDAVLGCLRREGARFLARHERRLSRDDHDDILNRTIEAIWDCMARLRGNSAAELRAYFFRTLNSRIVDHWRSREAERRKVQAVGEGVAGGMGGGPGLVAPDPEQTVEDRQEQAQLEELLRTTLSTLEFKVAMLKAQGYKDREIAEMLNLHIGTVATAASRARAKLLPIFAARFVKKSPLGDRPNKQ